MPGGPGHAVECDKGVESEDTDKTSSREAAGECRLGEKGSQSSGEVIKITSQCSNEKEKCQHDRQYCARQRERYKHRSRSFFSRMDLGSVLPRVL